MNPAVSRQPSTRGPIKVAMIRSKRWLFVSALIATLVVILGLSFSSIAAGQEARWEAVMLRAVELWLI